MSAPLVHAPLEMWAGLECTVNRVGDQYRDQFAKSGHTDRIEDLDRVAALGVRTVRYPVLWERLCPDAPDRFDWRWTDERMHRLRALGIRPIVGFLHHGSGPRWTSLVDPELATRLSEVAERVAERYPWIDAYTPVNEPLTTARFSGLYGHWYPHGRDPAVFARCLVHQCTAIVLAMARIRRVTPGAILVQTEDIGRIDGTPHLSYQVEFENERRWISFDLLAGRVDRDHPMHGHLLGSGVRQEELDFFLEHARAPDVLGVNHYITSDRFLDEDLAKYPPSSHGGNGRERYADVETVRARIEHTGEMDAVLCETWARYALPIAVTEAQLAGPREAQLRWLHSAWTAAERARSEGMDVRAVTAWSLFGAYDWNSLVTRETGFYESGAFDLRGPSPRPTAVARLVRDLATGTPLDEPVLQGLSWWRRPDRLFPDVLAIATDEAELPPPSTAGRPVLVCGANGTLGRTFVRLCEQRGIAHRALGKGELDVIDPRAIERIVAQHEPWAIVNAAGYVRVDDAELDRSRCFDLNVMGPTNLARVCARDGVRLLTFSSDLVFGGGKDDPYVESDAVGPMSVYGASKVVGERRVLERLPEALVVRTAAFFGPWDEANFLVRGLDTLASDRRWLAADDLVVSPTFVVDLVHTCLDLLIDHEHGVWHVANDGAVTWAALAQRVAVLSGLDPGRVDPRPSASFGWAAPRPSYSALSSVRTSLMPSLEDALTRFLSERARAVDARASAPVG